VSDWESILNYGEETAILCGLRNNNKRLVGRKYEAQPVTCNLQLTTVKED
jgi:hypothetical protein